MVARVVARIRDLEPSTCAVLVTGSYAKRTADEDSDFDLEAITREEPNAPYRMWFEGPLHVSVGVTTADGWLEARLRPARWSLGFAACVDARYAWVDDEGVRVVLGEPPSMLQPPGGPELEDFVESAVKALRAARLGDSVALRWFARAAGELAPRLLISLNDERVVHDARDAVRAALDLAAAPANYRDDLAVALGLRPEPDERVREATLRLARELLAFLREHGSDVDPQPDIARYLADGTLDRLFD